MSYLRATADCEVITINKQVTKRAFTELLILPTLKNKVQCQITVRKQIVLYSALETFDSKFLLKASHMMHYY